MQRSFLAAFLALTLAAVAWGQGSVSTGPPTAVNGLGQPIPGTLVAVCTSNPGLTPTPPCSSTLATTYTDITLASQCVGASATKPLSNPGGAGSSCSNPGFVDSKGNVIAYAAAGTYWCEYYGRGITTYVQPCLFPGAGSGGGSVGPGTLNRLAKFSSTTNVGNAVCSDDGITPMSCPLGVSLVRDALFTTKSNNGSTGTTVNLLLARDSSGNAINAQPTDTNNVIGIAGFGAGTTGTVSIAYSGQFNCKFDNQTAVGDWVILGASSNCHDAGATEPTGIENVGRVNSINSGAGTLAGVDLGLPDATNTSSGTGTGVVAPCATAGAMAYYQAVGNTVNCDSAMTTDGAGDLFGVSATFSGPSAGFIGFGQNPAPSLLVPNTAYFYGPTSIANSFGTALPAAPGLAGQALIIDTVPDPSHITTKWGTGCPEDTCIVNAPTGDQVIAGVRNLILDRGALTVKDTADFSTNNRLTIYTGTSGGFGRIEQYNPSNVLTAQIAFGNTALGGFPSSTGFVSIGQFNTPLVLSQSTASLGGVGAGLVFPGAVSGNAQMVVPDVAGSPVLTLPTFTSTFAGITPAGALPMYGSTSGHCDRTVDATSTTITEGCALSANINGTVGANIPSTGVFTGLTLNSITGSVQCLHVNSSGVVSGVGADCGSGGGGGVSSVSGTAAQITVVNGSTTPQISIPSTFTFPGTVTNNLSIFGATTSAQLAGVLSDETGSGVAVFGTSPTIVTPTIASFTNATHNHQNAAGGGTLTLSSPAFANQGTTTTVLHGNAAGNPAFSQITNSDISANTIDVSAKLDTTHALPVVNGGTQWITLTSAYTNATTTASNITDGTHNLAFSVLANTNYDFQCHLPWSGSSTTANLEVVVTGPASPTAVTIDFLNYISNVSDHDEVQTSFGGTLGTASAGAGSLNLKGDLNITLLNGANAGTVQIQGKAAGAGTITVLTSARCKMQIIQ